ncbi:MAG TPA: response regulator [bacterium]|nr:response regulator [bacterium]
MTESKKKILIVDDEEDLTWSISRKLQKDNRRLDIICANSGNQALKMLSQNKVDLMVTDLRMPGVNGWQLLDTIKSSYPQTQVIVMTAFGSLEIKQALSEWGRTGYIEKPFEIDELKRMIFHFLGEYASKKKQLSI